MTVPVANDDNTSSNQAETTQGSDVLYDHAYGIIPVLPPTAIQEHRYLLILHHKGHWGFPKGHKDAGESDLETAKRELQEETGLTDYVMMAEVEFTEHYRFIRPDGIPVRKEVLYFVALVPTDENGDPPPIQVQPEEISDFRWCTFDQAIKLLRYKEINHLIRNSEHHLRSFFKS